MTYKFELVEVNEVPLDGTEFVVVWCDLSDMMCDRGFYCDGLFMMNKYKTIDWKDSSRFVPKFFIQKKS